MAIEAVAIAAAMLGFSAEVLPVLKEYISKNKSSDVVFKYGGIEVSLKADTLKKLDTQELQDLTTRITQSDAKDVGTITLSRYAVTNAVEEPAPAPEAAGIALALGKEAVFRDARRRIELVFKMNLGVAIARGLARVSGCRSASGYRAVMLGTMLAASTGKGKLAFDLGKWRALRDSNSRPSGS
jgi:hypothetical protein